jgi:hypothetical protein
MGIWLGETEQFTGFFTKGWLVTAPVAAESNVSTYLRHASWLQKSSSSLIGHLNIQ